MKAGDKVRVRLPLPAHDGTEGVLIGPSQDVEGNWAIRVEGSAIPWSLAPHYLEVIE